MEGRFALLVRNLDVELVDFIRGASLGTEGAQRGGREERGRDTQGRDLDPACAITLVPADGTPSTTRS
jgi:hypothetical protein